MQQHKSPSILARASALLPSFRHCVSYAEGGVRLHGFDVTGRRCMILAAAIMMLVNVGRISAANVRAKASNKPVASNRTAPEQTRMTIDSLIAAGAYDSWVMMPPSNGTVDTSTSTGRGYRSSSFAPGSIEDNRSLPSLESVALMYARSVTATSPIRVQLLPAVFFDSASSEIARRYVLEPLAMGTSRTEVRTQHDAYLRVLDALATQLAASSDTVVLHGFEERTKGELECRLARSRAERIRDYLVNRRKISSARVRISNSNINCVPPDLTFVGGLINTPEYRRVEIMTVSGDPFQIYLEIPSETLLASTFANTSVVLFGARSQYVLRSERAKLASFITGLPADTEININGYAEVLAGTEQNTTLDVQRANSVAAVVTEVCPDCRVTLNFDTSQRAPLGLPKVDLPEKRYMSRSVTVRHDASGVNTGEIQVYNQVLAELETALAKRIATASE